MRQRFMLVAFMLPALLVVPVLAQTLDQCNDPYTPVACVYLPLLDQPVATPTATATTVPTTAPTVGPTLTPTRVPPPSVPPTPTRDPARCAAEYPTVCIPPPPPDLNCSDISYRNFRVLPPDRHNFDTDGDGIGCESR